jgi:hypothetical protein
VLGFMHLRLSHWLDILIINSLSIEVFSVFRQNCVVTGLRCSFSPLDYGVAQ